MCLYPGARDALANLFAFMNESTIYYMQKKSYKTELCTVSNEQTTA